VADWRPELVAMGPLLDEERTDAPPEERESDIVRIVMIRTVATRGSGKLFENLMISIVDSEFVYWELYDGDMLGKVFIYCSQTVEINLLLIIFASHLFC